MNNDIPQIPFKSKYSKVTGIEIITLESLMEKKGDLDHFLEKAHQLDFYMLVYYAQGETEHLVDFVWHKVGKDSLLYITKGQINAFKFNGNLKGYLIIFSESYFKAQLNTLPKNVAIRLFTAHLFSPRIQIPERSNVSQYISLFYNEFYNDKLEFNKVNIIDSLYTIIFSKLEQLKKYQTIDLKESSKLEIFLKFSSTLEQNFKQSRNADFYAVKLNITYKHLNVICKEIVKITAKQFIDEFIILTAKRKLINSNIKSTELAYLMGFEESSNFVKYFKKHTGFTPNSFKEQYL